MKRDEQTPLGSRVVRVARRLGIFAVLYAALQVNNLFIDSDLAAVLILATAFSLAYYFTSRRWLRGVILALAIPFFLLLGMNLLRVSASARSPDGRVLAEVYELPSFLDRNFIVRIKTKGRWGIPQYKDYFRSPDEGLPPTERLLWSKDGRYLLLLGDRKSLLTVEKEACLSSGECLYLLVDTEKDVVYTNARARDPRPFSVDDLSGIDFGESFTSVSLEGGKGPSHHLSTDPGWTLPADKKAGGFRASKPGSSTGARARSSR
jgi:hypothetical protein